MKIFDRVTIIFKSLTQLGLQAVGLYCIYQIMLKLGVYHLLTPAKPFRRSRKGSLVNLRSDLLRQPSPQELADIIGEQAARLLAEADNLLEGKIHLFGNSPVALELSPPAPLYHWSYYARQSGRIDGNDIKFVWEHARFDWAYKLARAYRLSQDERYAEAFWQYTLDFLTHNPINLGPNWVSSQEIALRLIAMVFAYQVFASSPTSTQERISALCTAIQSHAWRIPPTLIYARAQRNNHLLVEAAGMITAAHALSDQPGSQKLLRLGRKYFHQALQEQISPEGVYIQQSTNYHRLMLQIASWVFALEEQFPTESMRRLAAATHWLSDLVDGQNGKAPNLGHNDGANIQPLAVCPYHDYRPVLASAGRAFLNTQLYPPGPWDENPLWLGLLSVRGDRLSASRELKEIGKVESEKSPEPFVIRHTGCDSHAYIRTARFTGRPAHADQLHIDLWWRGLNLAQDAGTYLYNAPPPWENPFAGSEVHNTLTVAGRDQMLRAGRFLWLDWAQAEIVEWTEGDAPRSATAIHDGYRRFGLIHQRRITALPERTWQIEDRLIEYVNTWWNFKRLWDYGREKPIEARLHWLLPDWPYKLEIDDANEQFSLSVRSPFGWIRLLIDINHSGQGQVTHQIACAGKLISGSGEIPETRGWVSPTYGLKIPALSFSIQTLSTLPIIFSSQWILPEDHPQGESSSNQIS